MRRFILIPIVLLMTQTLFAADSAQPSSAWSGTVQFGYTGTGGNTQENNVNSKLSFLYKKQKWSNSYKLESLFSNSRKGTTAERYAGTFEFNYNFKPREFTFLNNSDVLDRFATYSQLYITSIGYGFRVYNGETVTVDLQGGPGYRYAIINDSNQTEQDAIGTVSSNLNWQISKSASFQENLSLNAGKDNTQTQSTSALSTDIVGNLGLQVSYTVTHIDMIPKGSKKTYKTDYRTDVTLLFSF